MKLDRITLENFGIYKRRSFQFDLAPLVVVYGPNEAGKTTALNGLRQAIFGFRMRTPYLTGGTMQAEIEAQLKSGQRLTFSRRKGKQDDVQGHLDLTKIDPSDIHRLLGSFDLGSYENLFGFSQDELRRGQETLKSARLTEALAGGSLGGMNALEKIRSELRESLEDLYKARGSKSKINLALTELGNLRDRLQEHELLPSQVEALRHQYRESQFQADSLKKEYDSLFLRRAAVLRKLEAMPTFLKLRSAEYELQQIDIPGMALMRTFVTQWGDYADQRKTLNDNLSKEKEACESDLC